MAKGICSVEDCPKDASKRGWCEMHYRRWRLYGDLNRGRLPRPTLTEKRCFRCRDVKPVSEFYFGHGRNRNGYSSYCKPCFGLRCEESRQRHLAKRQAAQRARYWAQRERWRKYDHERYWNDPARRESKRGDYTRHREKRQASVLAWKLANPERFRDIQKLNYARRRAAKQASASARVTPEALALKVAYWGDRCWVCKRAWSEIDHVKPISKGGSHFLCNLRPICRRCNAKKSARWPLSELRLASRAKRKEPS